MPAFDRCRRPRGAAASIFAPRDASEDTMPRFARLLVATDLSARSDRAVERAVLLAAETGARLTVLHVVDEDLPSRLAERHGEEARIVIVEQLSALPKASRTIETKVVSGRCPDAILRAAEAEESELIVLGAHRNETSRPVFVGRTAERVVRGGRWPVLLVSRRAHDAYRRVVVGVDFSVYSRRAVDLAMRAAPGAEFHLVHAFAVPFAGFLGEDGGPAAGRYRHQLAETIREEFGAFLAAVPGTPGRCQPIIREGSAREVLHQEVDGLRPDLLVIGTHGRTGVAHALLGSVAEDMLAAPPCDVLVVKAW
jgi:nucleotide-binding universal stress UspA family protein